MDNFENSNIITEVAFNKNTAKFIPRQEQMRLNSELKNKLIRFVSEMVIEENRPASMSQFDSMMNEMHGQRVKDLFKYRREGNHIVSLLCNSIPPELIYAVDGFIPVTVCMGGGEVEQYADESAKDMCSLSRSMLGFQNSGMCVFFNVSDYVIGSDLCSCIKKSATIIQKSTTDFETFCTESNQTDHNNLDVNHLSFRDWINKTTQNKGFNRAKLIEYSSLFSEMRAIYMEISNLRKELNPPINGRNSLWIQQLFLVEEPYKLLSALKTLKEELLQNKSKNIGFNPTNKKKRILLITPRIMPPFTEIFRLIENNNAIIVYEETCMGISNINYNIDKLIETVDDVNLPIEISVKYIMDNIDKTKCSCFKDFDLEKIIQIIKDFNVDAVINYSFNNCPNMIYKINKIAQLLNESGTPSMTLQTNYLEIYEKEDIILKKINDFLDF
ncbi:MAG: 2-hydroxyacyl-CoA dehydratase family protein [Bacteroidota bacterium]